MIQTKNRMKLLSSKGAIGERLIELAETRMHRGLAPPPDIYRIEYRRRIDWLQFPDWARPVDPQLFDGCCHEG
jgi:hypothetical protein